ncbi:MAG: tRNA (guanosine(46)-N7)-methyltransferase TrmB [Betaproteobacteria bacterium]|jgi:tRNA (guanine-N7-)-methyltransferase|nr:tRNA (guanosine(46)-N7)-methyltransferase TrmB [Betaproteobacteria bacterium]
MEYKPIRTYVKRQGRLTKAQKIAIEVNGKSFLIEFKEELLQEEQLFLTKQPICFEIGFGMGGATHKIAQNNSDTNYIVTDVHQPGIGNLIKLSKADNLTNIKIIPHDALEVLRFMIKDSFLSKVNIFFPDPWHKKRHNKRRLVNNENLNLIISKLVDGGILHIATDWEPYALEIIEAIKTRDNLTLMTNNFHERPDCRPETKYESRGMRLGHEVWDILATKG